MMNEIISFLKFNGPSLPVEIGKITNYNTYIMNAILNELVEKGIIKKSKRKIGDSFLYFLPGQEEKARERLATSLNIAEKKILEKFKALGQLKLSELTAHERAYINKLLDFLIVKKTDNNYIIQYYNYKPINKKLNIEIKPTYNELVKQSKNELVKQSKEQSKENFIEKVKEIISNIGEVIEIKKIKNNEYTIIAKVGMFKTLIKAKNKKSISESDLSNLYLEGINKKMPTILITNGKISKKLKKWKNENLGELIKVYTFSGGWI